MGKQKISISTTDIQCSITELGKIIQLHSEMSPLVAKGTDAMEKGLTPLLRNNMSSKALTVLRQINSTQSCFISLQSILQEVIAAYEDADVVLKGKVDKIPKAVVDWTKGPKGDEVNGATTVTVTDEKRNEIFGSKVGTVIANITANDNLIPPYDGINAPKPGWSQADKLQCVGYARGRFEELTGVQANISGDAIDWMYNYADDNRFEFVTDINDLKIPAIAVTNGDSTYGHVLVVEYVYTDSDGNKTIYYTEGNVQNCYDGLLKAKSYSEFYTGYTTPYGFVQLK